MKCAVYLSAGDEVGWARTRIGRLPICGEFNAVEEALNDAGRAHAILKQHREDEMLLRLNTNMGVVYSKSLGDHRRALDLYGAALEIAEALDAKGQGYLGLIYNAMGYAHHYLGEFQQALKYYEQAQTLLLERGNINAAALAEQNIAFIAQAQGRYRYALRVLHHVQEMLAESNPIDSIIARRDIVECYLVLRRHIEARELAQQIIAQFRELGATYEAGLTLLHLATAEAELSNFETAQAILDQAEATFTPLRATSWLATVHLRRGRIALAQHDLDAARREASAAALYFQSSNQRTHYAEAVLLNSQVLFASGNLAEAAPAGFTALRIAQQCHLPSLAYSAHLLIGRIAEGQGRVRRALRQYRAAVATIERVQRGLTITLRPGFLEDKGEALRALIAFHLKAGETIQAYESLGCAKAQVFLGYLANRDNLRWLSENPQTRALIEDLNKLRARHQWLYRLAYDPVIQEKGQTIRPEQTLDELACCERAMRAITDQLYLNSGDADAQNRAVVPSPENIQRAQPDDALLIEFYNDGGHLYAFTLDRTTLAVHPLSTPLATVDRLLAEFQFNLACVLKAGPTAPATRQLTGLARRTAQQLYTALIAPLAERIQDRRRLVIVPYGTLHYLPFHVLHSGLEYLIERYEVVVLPAACLATRCAPRRSGGALVLAHSWDGQLPYALTEAQLVHQLLGGDVYSDEATSRAMLQAAPRQVLHIAAHGEYRIDQPDLSYIQLADDQLYTDDLLQNDLSYELVTLSACETGRARVAAGDELIGLGRGFLYAGAGALIASLWQVRDSLTLDLMEHMYRALREGASKAAALRSAQLAVLHEQPELHPAFWAAFQLVGNADPLTAVPTAQVAKE